LFQSSPWILNVIVGFLAKLIAFTLDARLKY